MEGNNRVDVKKYTYNELKKSVCRCSNLLQRFGIKAGQRVVVYLPDCPELIFFYLACFRVGAVLVPVVRNAVVCAYLLS
jgi:acyl-coenzyme A synthetase/AMP-(fatty) acid ligase